MNFVVRNRSGFPAPFAYRHAPVNGSFDRLLNSVFEDLFQAPSIAKSDAARDSTRDSITPRINVTENDQTYIVEAEIPGVTKENVKVSVEDNQVTLEAEVKRGVEQKDGENVVHTERTVRKFVRHFKLAKDVDEAQIVAKLENGILSLTLPKKTETRSKQITVQ